MSNRFPKKILSKLLALVLVFLALLGQFSFASAAFNQQINYQGKLLGTTGSSVSDGTYAMTFKLYTASSGGSPIWTEARTGADEVQVTSGLFSVMLGSVTSLSGVDFDQSLWLGVTIESDSEMTPRKPLGAVPAAFVADKATYLGSASSTQYLRSDVAGMLSVSSASTGLIINQAGAGDILNLQDNGSEVLTVVDGGNVGIGTTTPIAKLSVKGSGTGTGRAFSISNSSNVEKFSVLDDGTVNFSNTLNVGTNAISATNYSIGSDGSATFANGNFEIFATGAMNAGDISVGTITGTGDFIDLSAHAAGNINTSYSVMSGGGLATMSDLGLFLAANGASGAGNLAYSFTNDTDTGFYRAASDEVRFQTGGSDRLTITSAGFVGIGTTTPSDRLHVRYDGSGSTYQARYENGTAGGTAGFILRNSSGWDIRFRTNPSNGWFEITDSGSNIQHRWHGKNYMLASDGVLYWSSETNFATAGNGAADTNLFRSSANVLRTNDAFTADGLLTAGANLYVTTNAGISVSSPSARLQILSAPADSGSFSLSNWNGTGSAVSAFIKTPNTNGGSSPATAEPALVLGREGVSGQAYANFAEFKIRRYEHSGVAARTALDIALTHGNGDAAGTNIMSLLSSGNVGIGTTTPVAKLAVTGTAGTGDVFAIASSTNARMLTVTHTGNVGIGTSSPLAKLDLYGGDLYFGQNTYDATIKVADISSGDSLQGGDLTVSAGSATAGSNMAGGHLILKAGNSRTGSTHVSGDLRLYAGANNFVSGGTFGDMEFYTGGYSGSYTQAMTLVGATGNLLIGTTTDVTAFGGAKLQVRGSGSSSSTWRGRIVAGGDNAVFLMGEYNSNAWLGAHNSALSAWANMYIQPQGGADVGIGYDGTTLNTSTDLVLGGMLGIGTTSPSAKLAVTGTAGTGDIFTLASSTNSQYLTLKSTGRLGLGTTVPTALLDIVGSTASLVPLRIQNPSSSSNYSFLVEDPDGTDVLFHNTAGGTASVLQVTSTTTKYFKMESYESDNNYFTAAGSTFSIRTAGGGYNIAFFTDTSTGRALISGATGHLVVGTTAQNGSARVHSIWTGGAQFRSEYDSSNYATITTGSTGTTVFDTNGTANAFSFSDNVGIGTTTPIEKLQVHAATGQVSAGIRTSFTDATSYGEWNVTENGSYKGGLAIFGSNYTTASWRDAMVISSVTNNTGSVIFRTRTGGNYAERMIVTNAGNVGIGTTTPTALLDLLSTTEQMRVGYDALNYYTTTVGSSGLVMFNAVGSGSGFHFTDSISTDGLVRLDGSAGNDYIWHSGSNKVHITTAGFDRLTVDGSGNVGIGTTTPAYLLSVAGDADITGALRFSGNAGTSGYVLQSTGSSAQWVATSTLGITGGSGSPGGLDTYVQFNDGGVFGGDGGFVYNKTNDLLTVTYASTTAFTASGAATLGYLKVTAATEQSRVGYDASNYLTTTVAADGAVTFDAVGTDPEFNFSDNVGINTVAPSTELEIYGSNGGAANIYLTRNDSTTVTGDELGGIAWGSTDGPSPNAAAINAYATENFSSSAAGTYMTFRTSAAGGDTITEQMRITDAGNVGIGTTSPQRKLHVRTTADEAPVRFEDTNGYCEINPTSTTWTCTSDERLKENIRDLVMPQGTAGAEQKALERLAQLRPVNFEWKNDDNNQDRTGLIAQEVEKIFPDLVQTDESGYKSVSYGGFTIYIIQAMKEVLARIDSLEQFVTNGAGQVTAAVVDTFERLKVGSSDKPTGITLYDEETGEPYCLKIKGGEAKTTPGECEIVDRTAQNEPPAPSLEPQSDQEGTEGQGGTGEETDPGTGSTEEPQSGTDEEPAPSGDQGQTGSEGGSETTSVADTSGSSGESAPVGSTTGDSSSADTNAGSATGSTSSDGSSTSASGDSSGGSSSNAGGTGNSGSGSADSGGTSSDSGDSGASSSGSEGDSSGGSTGSGV